MAGALLLTLVVACESSRSNGGPKVKVTPDTPAPTTTFQPPPVAGPNEAGSGVADYPTQARTPPPVALPAGKGLNTSLQRYIVIDQFGYRPAMTKVAVLANPVNGWNGRDVYQPGDQLEVRKWSDASVAWKGPVSAWNAGGLDEPSGDRGSWFDFSSFRTPGLYYVFDPKNFVRSHPFEIDDNVYRKALIAATKMYYFNRANFEKKPPYSCVDKRCWSLRADYLGPGQDSEARSITNRDSAKTERDLRGGWWDAGDTNKYVTFATEAVHGLLTAYREHPAAFTDDFQIPESGNGLPDVLDEIKVELDWLKRMQADDLGGGVLIKVGQAELTAVVPDESRVKRYYYPAPCSSSAIAVASMFAHASLVLGKIESEREYADQLKKRAIAAYADFVKKPKSDKCDDQSIKAGDADWTLDRQAQMQVVAAVFLFALTGEKEYATAIEADFKRTRPFKENRWSVYEPSQGDALLYYAALPNADAKVKDAILDRKRGQAAKLDIYKFKPESDLYRAYMRSDSYHWGSNRERATVGSTNYDLVEYDLVPKAEQGSFIERAAGMLHSFHGVNPMQIVYLTNMYAFGAEECVDEMFHSWFRDNHPIWDNARTSKLGPAPGYVVGGPNAQYCKWQNGNQACKQSPIRQQPPEKAFINSNKGWEPQSPFDKTWELTEPGIYYQAAYVRLVSKFVN